MSKPCGLSSVENGAPRIKLRNKSQGLKPKNQKGIPRQNLSVPIHLTR